MENLKYKTFKIFLRVHLCINPVAFLFIKLRKTACLNKHNVEVEKIIADDVDSLNR